LKDLKGEGGGEGEIRKSRLAHLPLLPRNLPRREGKREKKTKDETATGFGREKRKKGGKREGRHR